MNLPQLYKVFDVFQKGRAVANPEAWKKGQITATLLTPFLVALIEFGRSLGYNIPVTEDQLVAIAGGFVAVVNIVLTITTTTKIGTGNGVPIEELPPDSSTDSGSRISETSSNGISSRSDLGYERTSGPSNAFNNRDNAGG